MAAMSKRIAADQPRASRRSAEQSCLQNYDCASRQGPKIAKLGATLKKKEVIEMPTWKPKEPSEGEAEGLATTTERITSNLALADYMGKFVSGKVMEQFGTKDIKSMINEAAIGVTVSWG